MEHPTEHTFYNHIFMVRGVGFWISVANCTISGAEPLITRRCAERYNVDHCISSQHIMREASDSSDVGRGGYKFVRISWRNGTAHLVHKLRQVGGRTGIVAELRAR